MLDRKSFLVGISLFLKLAYRASHWEQRIRVFNKLLAFTFVESGFVELHTSHAQSFVVAAEENRRRNQPCSLRLLSGLHQRWRMTMVRQAIKPWLTGKYRRDLYLKVRQPHLNALRSAHPTT